MKEETHKLLQQLENRVSHMSSYLGVEEKKTQLRDLESKMESPTFWEDQSKAQKVIEETNLLKSWVQPYEEIVQEFEGSQELIQEADSLGDDELLAELEKELIELEKKVKKLEVKRMLSGELDGNNCYLSLYAGAGGTESCDWVSMLLRMYEKWALKKGYKAEYIDILPGEVAGVKNVTIKFSGKFAYGYCKAEKGVHRLVRISPFDSNAKRHTSFAAVEVTPEISEDVEIEINPEDLKVDTFRSSGAGGQHVNTTDSAVRLTHLPSGIVVSCQNQRSQHQNKESCLKILKSKLYEIKVLERENKVKQLQGDKKENAWGNQIRSYVFQPYCLVKDSRTAYETGNVEAMMDGDLLDDFIEEYLKKSESV
ncbi:MAG: peptide chain release factor 2 [Chlamydiales bacterium]|nr:peptide chain release factor 2 [Chlamydiales bacterium]NCF70971.1 peptide chain release factor 2 [Chlamydiales bacterium]